MTSSRFGVRFSDSTRSADTLEEMTGDQIDVLAASSDATQAVDTPTVLDAEELDKARLDERWREFCLNAERYVAESTRPQPRVSQPA